MMEEPLEPEKQTNFSSFVLSFDTFLVLTIKAIILSFFLSESIFTHSYHSIKSSFIPENEGFLSYINCRSVRWAMNVQDFFTLAKLFALFLIISFGLYHITQG